MSIKIKTKDFTRIEEEIDEVFKDFGFDVKSKVTYVEDDAHYMGPSFMLWIADEKITTFRFVRQIVGWLNQWNFKDKDLNIPFLKHIDQLVIDKKIVSDMFKYDWMLYLFRHGYAYYGHWFEGRNTEKALLVY